METQAQTTSALPQREPWNKGKLIGQKPPLRPKHVWSIRTRLQMEGRTRACNPDRDEPSILPGRHRAVMITTATEQKFAGFLARGFDVIIERLPRLFRQFKPDGPTGLLLPHCGAIDRIAAWCDVLHPNCDDIAAPQLAVDCQIERRDRGFAPASISERLAESPV